ncbi:MAG: nicotinamide riboside transporter PnuC [Bryobacterales bacterium]|nr:nicotinamide riboside transporter PnuC [Bryobacterales bacterium]
MLGRVSPIEILGFLTGAVNVWLLARQNIWNWPAGLANNALYIAVFATAGLYGDAGLQLAYITLGVYGWWNWAHTGREAELRVVRTPRAVWAWLVLTTVAAAFGLQFFLRRFTDSTVPAWDGVTTALSVAAIYGQCRKYLESWWIWIAADLIYIPLYIYKDLWITAGLYFVFLLLCVIGLREWSKAHRAQQYQC